MHKLLQSRSCFISQPVHTCAQLIIQHSMKFNEVCFLLDFDNCVSICGDVEKKGSTGKVCMIKHNYASLNRRSLMIFLYYKIFLNVSVVIKSNRLFFLEIYLRLSFWYMILHSCGFIMYVNFNPFNSPRRIYKELQTIENNEFRFREQVQYILRVDQLSA